MYDITMWITSNYHIYFLNTNNKWEHKMKASVKQKNKNRFFFFTHKFIKQTIQNIFDALLVYESLYF